MARRLRNSYQRSIRANKFLRARLSRNNVWHFPLIKFRLIHGMTTRCCLSLVTFEHVYKKYDVYIFKIFFLINTIYINEIDIKILIK